MPYQENWFVKNQKRIVPYILTSYNECVEGKKVRSDKITDGSYDSIIRSCNAMRFKKM